MSTTDPPVPDRRGAQLEGSAQAATAAIDVVIPVYNAPVDARRCVDSVLAHTTGDYRLVLIDDASPDQGVAALFAELAARRLPQLLLLANDVNLGFTGTANRGMGLLQADVVLLNSDTIVTAGWLEALARCAASDPRIATATPFSNNAEICSFPHFCADNPWREGDDPEAVRAALAAAAVPTYPDLPTGVGFCLYIRRAAIEALGVFDTAFGKGYGEENDFCLRAIERGLRNVLCDDAFVLHAGERSFVGRKSELGPRNMALLLERHPGYLDLVRGYIAADPLRPLRAAALARGRADAGRAPGVLHVIHGHGGGTEHHVRALVESSRSRWRHYLAIATGDRWQLEEHLDDGTVRAFDFHRPADDAWSVFINGLCATFGAELVHLHNVSGCRDGILAALPDLAVPYGYTVHDLNFACPTITFIGTDGMYCGGQTDPGTCGRCLAAQPDFAGIDIASWRARHRRLLDGAAFIIAPSRWTADMLARYFPGLEADVIAHGAPDAWALQPSADPAPRPAVPMPDDDVPTVAVLGAIGPDKGARRLDSMVERARAQRLPLRFVLIGYLDRLQTPWQSDDAVFTVHGRYAPCDLPELLAHYRVRLVAFPSAGPETFSLTLSEAWAAGRPVVVPPIGALAERVAAAGAGWVLTDDEWRDDARILARIAALVAPAAAPELAAAARRALDLPQRSLAAMAGETLARYDAARAAWSGREAGTPRPASRLPAARVRDALGYVPWHPPESLVPRIDATVVGPPPAASPPAARESGALAAVARIALRLRPTLVGRILNRVIPLRVRVALKSKVS